jgi:hypothetical protein
MTRNTADMTLSGPLARQMARNVLSTPGLDPADVERMSVSMSIEDGTGVSVVADGPLAGAIVAQMFNGVDWDALGGDVTDIHADIDVGETSEDVPDETFECEHCGENFDSKDSRDGHKSKCPLRGEATDSEGGGGPGQHGKEWDVIDDPPADARPVAPGTAQHAVLEAFDEVGATAGNPMSRKDIWEMSSVAKKAFNSLDAMFASASTLHNEKGLLRREKDPDSSTPHARLWGLSEGGEAMLDMHPPFGETEAGMVRIERLNDQEA